MYQPPDFREDHLDGQHGLIRAFPLGLLVAAGPDGSLANPIPFLLDAGASERGTLLGHLARANGQVSDRAAVADRAVLFQGPQGAVTPDRYATKRDTGKVVPTWNDVVVQVRGRAQVERLTRARESSRPPPRPSTTCRPPSWRASSRAWSA